MKKSIRAVALAAAIMLTASSLVGCSAYKNPEKYITIPGKGEVVVKNADIKKEYDENVEEIREGNIAAPYAPIKDRKDVDEEDKIVKDGDKVYIYYTGTPKGVNVSAETLEGMKYTKDNDENGQEGYGLVIGSGSFIKEYVDSSDKEKNNKGFEEQLIGKKAGDKDITVTVTFPADYQTTELQKVVAEFKVEILSIERSFVNHDPSKDAPDTQITVGYEFTNPNATEDKEDDKKDDTSAQAEGDNDSKDEAETPTETKKFEDIFKSGTFTYDFTDVESSKGKKIFDFIEIDNYIEKLKELALNGEHSVNVEVPDDAGDAYKDYETINMKLTVTKIERLPDWNDEFINEYTSGQYKTVAEYEEYAMKALRQSKAFEVISEKVVVNEYPKSELESAYKNYVYQLVYSKLGNKDPGDFTQKELEEKISESDYQTIYNSAAVSAKDSVKQRLTIEYLCNYFDISLSKKEYNEKLSSELSSNFYNYYQYGIYDVNSLESYYGKDYFELQFKTEKMLEKITEYVTFED